MSVFSVNCIYIFQIHLGLYLNALPSYRYSGRLIMMLEQRALQLLDVLIRSDLITMDEIQDRMGLSRRQIDYDLEKINSWLMHYPKIQKLKRKGITIPPETKKYLMEKLSMVEGVDTPTSYTFTEMERITFIYFLLFTREDYTSLNHFVYSLDISRSTVLKDIRILEKRLMKFQICIMYDRMKGYSLQGDERNIRYFMIRLVISMLASPNGSSLLDWFMKQSQLLQVKDVYPVVQNLSKIWSIKFVEYKMHEFIYSFILILSRLKTSEKPPTIEENHHFQHYSEFALIEELLQHYQIDSKNEKNYFCAWILGLSVGNIQQITRDRTTLVNLVKGIIERFESLAGIRFTERKKVVSQVYMHFRPAYYRILFKLPIVNPLMEKVQKEYKELYKLVQETMKPFHAVFQNEIPSEEIAYLTIHFGSIINSTKEKHLSKKVAAIICPSGVGTSAIVYKELRSIFPEFKFLPPVEVEQFDSITKKVDILFSTVPITRFITQKTPFVIVNPIMTSLEKSNVIRNVYAQLGNPVLHQPSISTIIRTIEQYAEINDKPGLERSIYELFSNSKKERQEVSDPVLSEITSEKLIQLDVVAVDWEDAIRKAGQPLVNEAKVSPDYIQAMVDTAKESGPYMVISKHVALPHARPEAGSREISISITKLKNPICFGNEENDPVKYIFCLSAIDNETHLNAMAELVELLEGESFYRKIDEATKPKEIYDYILQFENQGELR